jgi:hypothetical protein
LLLNVARRAAWETLAQRRSSSEENISNACTIAKLTEKDEKLMNLVLMMMMSTELNILINIHSNITSFFNRQAWRRLTRAIEHENKGCNYSAKKNSESRFAV